jgi:hypothetical protein
MCIAFPKAGEGDDSREPGWKSALLFVPRLLALVWMVLKMLVETALDRFREQHPRAM